jgi:hypothetical protein
MDALVSPFESEGVTAVGDTCDSDEFPDLAEVG